MYIVFSSWVSVVLHLLHGIQYLVKEDILKIPPTTQGTNYGSNQIPTWIKNNALWWSDDAADV
ncbi:hypothetical protein BD31_I1650 [Candidatus Nitrosopumilus salaria BD31]|uniref:Uncharacterized protein n=1 Tax=Candidatus Nitrosopumilus salarius BD31 TaxID=859350 RepID=I3D141_9ARCH|nr:hypothetical protein [Candidatus Nitrosopumilus salaria]EIJ65434.1 hypothetical protein BD31_I1650 [Candidatus Nitrosopumilus salaria BD31]